MREPGPWLFTAVAGLVAFVVGTVLEQHAIADRNSFGGPGPWIADGVAVALGCVAVHQWSRQPRRRPTADVGAGLPTWQGYGIALLGVAWLALATATWSLTELRSPSLTLGMLVAAVGHLVAGGAVVRRDRAGRGRVDDAPS